MAVSTNFYNIIIRDNIIIMLYKFIVSYETILQEFYACILVF